MPRAGKGPSISEFMGGLRLKSQADKVLAIGYYLETFRGAASFAVADIRKGYLTAKLAPSANISTELRINAKRNFAIPLGHGRYTLTQDGVEYVMAKVPAEGEPERIGEDISAKLRTDVLKIVDEDEREYIEEALKCLRVEAYRGAVLMGWAATMSNIHRKIDEAGLGKFNKKCKEFMKKPRPVRQRSDLQYYRDSDILLAAEGMGLFDRNVRAALKRHLDLRNDCGHPGQVNPQIHVVNAFFEEIIQYVLGVA
jgi:hypothetical protein